MKYRFLLSTILLCLLLAACGQQPEQDQEAEIATIISPTQTAAPAEPEATAAATGFISGRVHLMAPPTPEMAVYALDMATNLWVMVETTASDGEASFTLEVQPGTYAVFAFALDGSGYAGYPAEGDTDLGLVSVAAGQSVTDIEVRPPSQAECGTLWGVPPSPDGRYPSFSASDDCLSDQAARLAYGPLSESVCLTLQEIAQGTLPVTFTLEAAAPFTDIATGETGQGCTLTAAATGAVFSDPNQIVRDLVTAYQGWEEQNAYQAGGPTGAVTGLTRDMALMLITAVWEPAPEVTCPDDKPITECGLAPEQQLYTIRIQAAQK